MVNFYIYIYLYLIRFSYNHLIILRNSVQNLVKKKKDTSIAFLADFFPHMLKTLNPETNIFSITCNFKIKIKYK